MVLFWHFIGFVSPACILSFGVHAVFLRCSSRLRIFRFKRTLLLSSLMINVAISVLGLWLFSQDGKMVTYTMMVFISGTIYWMINLKN